MRITEVLFRWKKALPGGHLWHGKHKLYRKVTPKIKSLKLSEFELEEQNMFYLRNPYLTVEQAQTQTLPLTVEEKNKLKKEIEDSQWKKHKLLGDRFGFLKVSDRWE